MSSRDKGRAKKELLRAVEEVNSSYTGAKIRISDSSSYARRGQKNIKAVGVFSGTSSGFGFVSTDGYERDIFIPDGNVGAALDGDTVEISYHTFISRDGEKKTEGRVTKIIEEGRSRVIGTVATEWARIHRRRVERFYVIPDNSRFSRRIYINDEYGVNEGDKVEARLIRHGAYGYLECEIIHNFGDSYSKEANYAAILTDEGIEAEFTKAELTEAEIAASEPLSYDGRVIRRETIFTIDSESAKDLDDAVSVTKLSDGTWRLGVHIADVSTYVKEKCALDRLVMRRGTSVYFTDKVVPMLPEALSNGACSLNPGEEKYALSAIITLSSKGDILSTKIEKSVIRSKIKGIYSEINSIFDGSATKEIKEKYKSCIPSLKKMHELYLILLEKSKKRGALELEGAEAEIILDENGHPCDILRRERGDAEKMIEQFMLAANEGVATLLSNADIPCVYRVHEAPPNEKLEAFITYAKSLGLNTRGLLGEKISSKDLSDVLAEAKEKGLSLSVSYSMLRAMAKASYSEIRQPHFGLGIQKYCHFTSPIRRLSDLATHRIIHNTLLGEKQPKTYSSYAKRAARAATDGELRAMSAERRIENLYKVIYMSDKIDEVFPAVITSVTQFGLFAMLENTCEGLIPLSELGADFVFDEKTLSVRRGLTSFSTGDLISIRVEEADIIKGKLRFSLEDSHALGED